MKTAHVAMVAGVVVAGVAGWALVQRLKGVSIADTSKAIGGAVVDMASGLLVGSVETIGQAVGVQKTERTACEKAMAEGRTWDASFACPAGDFLKYLWS